MHSNHVVALCIKPAQINSIISTMCFITMRNEKLDTRTDEPTENYHHSLKFPWGATEHFSFFQVIVLILANNFTATVPKQTHTTVDTTDTYSRSPVYTTLESTLDKTYSIDCGSLVAASTCSQRIGGTRASAQSLRVLIMKFTDRILTDMESIISA